MCRDKRSLVLSSMEGYIASYVTETTGCGGRQSPWTIKVLPGQTVDITLYDFALMRRDGGLLSGSQCQVYATIKEQLSGTQRTFNVCSLGNREKLVYSSKSNLVEVTVMTAERVRSRDEEQPRFLLKYQGTSVLFYVYNFGPGTVSAQVPS